MRRREPLATVCRFGPFVLNRQAGELRKNGVRLKLQQKPLQLLCLLLDNAGNIVNRNEIRNALWPPDVHVDYDNAINSAVRKLREALCDSSERPRFIETVARDGYRFIGELEAPGGEIDLLQRAPRIEKTTRTICLYLRRQ